MVTTAELRLAPTSDDMAEASVTGHTVTVSPTMLVTITGWTAELPWAEMASEIAWVAVAAGQFVTVGAQEMTVWSWRRAQSQQILPIVYVYSLYMGINGLLQQLTCVTWTVRVVCSPPTGAGVVSGAPVIAATDESEAISDEASVVVRTVVDTGTISVATELPAGQLVMLAAQDVTVYRLVAYTVEVTS